MINLRTAIMTKLKEYHSNVTFQQATDNTTFPYIAYTFPNSFTLEEQEVFVMDIDIWDNKQDTTGLETLSTEIWRDLDKYCYLDDDIQFIVHRSNRLFELENDNPDINRRKLIFQIKYYDRSR